MSFFTSRAEIMGAIGNLPQRMRALTVDQLLGGVLVCLAPVIFGVSFSESLPAPPFATNPGIVNARIASMGAMTAGALLVAYSMRRRAPQQEAGGNLGYVPIPGAPQ